MGKGGIEPPLSEENQILSLARLPIPPLALMTQHILSGSIEVATNVLYNRSKQESIDETR